MDACSNIIFNFRKKSNMMTRAILILLFLLPGMVPGRIARAQADRTVMFYLGTFTSEGAEGLSLCTLDTVTGEMATVRVFKGIDNPGFLTISPDRQFMYVATRGPKATDPDGGAVSAFRIMEDGGLQFLNKQTSAGEDPCFVEVSRDGKWVAAANYSGGSVVLYPVGEDGELRPAASVVRHEGSGPRKNRQARPYAHSIRFTPFGETVYAADLGADRLFAYRLQLPEGKLVATPDASALLPAGSGPRHFDFTPDGRFCYVANELSSTVTVFAFRQGRMHQIQDISALPAGYEGVSYCADIHLSPCGRFLYVTNRGHNSVAVFSRDGDTGEISPLAYVPVEGNWPRHMALAPGGRFLLVANQRSHNITLFRLENGLPVFTGKELKTPAPVCIVF